MPYLLRRRKLGMSSCREIANFSKTGISWFRNDKALPMDDDLVFRWGCTTSIPQKRVVNKSAAIHLASDKTAFRRILQAAELCPWTMFSVDAALERLRIVPGGLVVRPSTHHQGRHFYYVTNEQELRDACRRAGHGCYISEYIDKVAEYRVFVVQGRCVCVAQKTPANPKAKAWNVAQGGRFDNVSWDNWPLKAVKRAITAHELSGLDFSGVDVMVDAKGKCYILEINSAPSLTSPYRQECMAKAFDYIVTFGKDVLPMINEPGGYKKFIHPAIHPNAYMM